MDHHPHKKNSTDTLGLFSCLCCLLSILFLLSALVAFWIDHLCLFTFHNNADALHWLISFLLCCHIPVLFLLFFLRSDDSDDYLLNLNGSPLTSTKMPMLYTDWFLFSFVVYFCSLSPPLSSLWWFWWLPFEFEWIATHIHNNVDTLYWLISFLLCCHISVFFLLFYRRSDGSDDYLLNLNGSPPLTSLLLTSTTNRQCQYFTNWLGFFSFHFSSSLW